MYFIAIMNTSQAKSSQVSSVLLLLPKDTICDWARDVVVCGCSLPYMNNLQKKTKETKGIYQLIVANNKLEVL